MEMEMEMEMEMVLALVQMLYDASKRRPLKRWLVQTRKKRPFF